MAVNSDATVDTVYPADTVELCPSEGYTDLLVCGTYKIFENTQKPLMPGLPSPKAYRKGQCLVFQVQDSEGLSLKPIQSLDFPAIPDVKWCHGDAFARPTLAIADSEGSVTVCQWDANSPCLSLVSSLRVADVDTLCLSLDWNNRLVSTNPPALAVSLSNGELAYLQVDDTGSLRAMNTWHAHDYEPWITAWNYHDPNLLFSGGDDLTLKLWDIRAGFDTPATVNKRFDAGVTTVQTHLYDPNLVAVGSYDEKVRFFDTRNLLRPLSELQVGGGVWRLKWHSAPERQDDLLVACMHDGFKVVNHSRGGEATILKEFREHESLAYGADWYVLPGASSVETKVASCSFYDHKLCLWTA